MKRLLAIAVLALAFLSPAPALAQCAMCSTAAHAAGEKSSRSLMRGVFVLLLPPLGLMMGLVGLAFYHKREG